MPYRCLIARSEIWRRCATALVAAPLLVPNMVLAQEADHLAALRERALELVNASRQEQGLGSLELAAPLDEAAQSHARNMLEQDFYSHVAPDGSTVRDRFIENGGSRWKLVAENIARCSGCAAPPDPARVEAFHEGWMHSPGHRENILTEGLESFGFGIAGEGDEIFAVQTFAGPGASRGAGPGEEAVSISDGEQVNIAVEAVNRARKRAQAGAVSSSAALDEVAEELLFRDGGEDGLVKDTDNLFDLLPGNESSEWRSLRLVAAGCGGCGTNETAADVRSFVQQWLDNPQYEQTLLSPEADALGFAMYAGGEGRKVAVAVAGTRR